MSDDKLREGLKKSMSEPSKKKRYSDLWETKKEYDDHLEAVGWGPMPSEAEEAEKRRQKALKDHRG